MKFAIATVEYFQSVGFDTTHWRKSLDGTLAMAHAEFALILCDINNVDVYDVQDEAFKRLLESEDWSEQEHIEEEEPII